MATTSMTSVDNILKEIYESQLQDQLNSEVKTLRRIEKTSEGVTDEVGGKYVTFPIRTQRNHGIGARLENEALPAARTQGYAQARVRLKYLYGSIQLTGQVIKLAKTNQQAFASALDQEINGLKEGLAKDLNRQVYGTTVGKLATTNAAGTITTLVMSNNDAIYLEKEMILDVYLANDTLQASGAVITNIQKDTPAAGSTTVTVAATMGGASASGWYVTRDDSKDREITGLRNIVSASGTLYNIDPTVEPVWKAEVDATGGALSESLMVKMSDRIQDNGGNTTVIFTTRGIRLSYFNLLSQQREIVNTQKFAGGFTGLAFATDDGDIPVVTDKDCPKQTMFFLNEKEIKIYHAGDWSWMDEDGSIWQRVIGVSGSTVNYFDAYTATMCRYLEIGTHQRNSHGMLSGLTEA